MTKGAVLLIDYGYTQSEYYLAERNMGTLLCHYCHRAHDDPLKFIGLQDITASVDFSAVSRAAVKAGFSLAGYTPQANFLIASGIEKLIQQHSPDDTENFYKMTQSVKLLMLPGEMGERFKVMGLLKDLEMPLIGFSMRDFSDRL
jgi:SAM-dependent MidA family methyltransferase